jgi:hypothetical protein
VSKAPFIKGSSTSEAAALQLTNLGAKRAAVLRFIEAQGRDGATDEEIQIGLGMPSSTERPRRVELFEARFICKGVFQRQTRSKRWANVYLLPKFAEPGDHLEFAPAEKPRCPHCNRPF